MPADYTSTARALAIPVSPLHSPLSTSHTTAPPWIRSRSTSSTRQHLSPYAQSALGWKDQWIKNADKFQRRMFATYQKLVWWQKVLTCAAIVVILVIGILL